jgi:hypothetical protein
VSRATSLWCRTRAIPMRRITETAGISQHSGPLRLAVVVRGCRSRNLSERGAGARAGAAASRAHEGLSTGGSGHAKVLTGGVAYATLSYARLHQRK